MVVFIFILPKKPIKIKNDGIWKTVCVSKPTCHFERQMKHRIRLEWKLAGRRKELGGKSDVPHFLKIMVLILYGLVFITKEIRAICLHTLKRKEEGKRELGVEVTGKEIWKDISQTFSETKDINTGFWATMISQQFVLLPHELLWLV